MIATAVREHLQRRRDTRAEQHDDAEGEGDIGRGRDGPALQCRRIASIDQRIDAGRDGHAAKGRGGGQDRLTARCELPFDEFAFDFQANEEEEHRHPKVVDPMQERLFDYQQAADIDRPRNVSEVGVELAPR